MKHPCPFCGQPSSKKTKEHVIPQWFLALFGDDAPLRIWTPLRPGGPGIREFSPRALQFPACDPCNRRYSALEGAAKPVVERLVAYQPLSDADFRTLLDWFDKVRVGLWLGIRLLEGNALHVTPNFHVTDRIGTKDRALLIYRTMPGFEGWGAFGTSTPAFHFQPSCFTLVITDFYLLNVSLDFMLARGLGLPFPGQVSFGEGPLAHFGFVPGLRRQAANVMPFPDARGAGEVYQPNLKVITSIELPDADAAYVTSFVRDANGAGPILIRGSGEELEALVGPTTAWRPAVFHPPSARNQVFLRQTLEIQNALLRMFRPHVPRFAEEFDNAVRFNEAQLAEIDRRRANP